MTETSRVGERGQAVIPKPIRDAVGIVPGDTLAFRVEKDRIIVEKAGKEDVVAGLGALLPRKAREPRRIDWNAEYDERFPTR
jgi:antitoxin PrlF